MDFKLYNDDCLSIMKTLDESSVDLILTDLPYGATSMEWDQQLDLDKFWECVRYCCKENANIVLFASGLFTYQLYESNKSDYKYKLIWKKNVPTGMSSAKFRPMKYYEEILVFCLGNAVYNPQLKDRVGIGKDCYRYEHYCGSNNHVQLDKKPKKYDPLLVQPSDVLEFDVVPNRKGKIHPTEKPVDLCEWLIDTYSNENAVVLDCCMGSGTIGVACLYTNRKFIGIEKNKEFYEMSKTRLEISYQMDMFL